MKVYAVMIAYPYEGDTLDSLWATFERAQVRALELLADEPYDLGEEAPGFCSWQFKWGGEISVSELDVGT